jgi:hypothetical protein
MSTVQSPNLAEQGAERQRCALTLQPASRSAQVVACVGRWYDAGKEVAVIELTEQQMQALANPEASPPRVVNPRTKETFVLLPLEEYERLTEEESDDSPWTREELEALAWEVAEQTDWDEYDDDPEKS